MRSRAPYELYKRKTRDGELSPYWYVDFTDRDGRRVRKSTKEADQKRAHARARQLEHRFGDPTYKASHEATVGTAAVVLKEHLENRGRSKATIRFYGEKLSHLGRVLGEDLSLASVSSSLVDGYIRKRRKEGAARYTVAKELTALRMLLKVARRRGEFDKEVSQVMPVGYSTGYKPRTRRVTVDEAWALIKELATRSPSSARYTAFVCATTARDSAAARALGEDLVYQAGTDRQAREPERQEDRKASCSTQSTSRGTSRPGECTEEESLRRLYGVTGIRVRETKTKAGARVVPLTKVTRPFAAFAFDGVERGRQVAPGMGNLRHAYDTATRRLGMAHLSPNDIRRSVAHWHLQAGVPRDVVAAFMGHTSTKMLDMVYGRLDAEEIGQAMARVLG